MFFKILLITLLNCYGISEDKSIKTTSEVGKGEFIISKVIKINQQKEFVLPFISGKKYLLVVENADESKPKLIIDGELCDDNFKFLIEDKDSFKKITLESSNCSTLVISFITLK